FSLICPGSNIDTLGPIMKILCPVKQFVIADVKRRALKQKPVILIRPFHDCVNGDGSPVGSPGKTDSILSSISRFHQRADFLLQKFGKPFALRVRDWRREKFVRIW